MDKRKTRFIIRKRAMGDVLWIEPVIRKLSESYNLVVNTKFNALFSNYPYNNVRFVDQLSFWLKVKLLIQRNLGVDLGFVDLEMAYEKHPRMHMLHAYQKVANLPEVNEYPKIFSQGVKPGFIDPKKKYVVLHLETLSGRNFRNVYNVDWEKVVAQFRARGLDVFQVGLNPDELKDVKNVSTTIPELIYLLKQAALFIGIDSGPSQIAASLQTPAIIFFGAVNPQYRHFPELLNGITMQSYCEFQNCYHSGISTNGFSCKLVGDEGIPKCSVHSTDEVVANINKLLTL